MASEQTPRAVVERWVDDLLRELGARSASGARLRVAGAKGGLACLVLVWPADARIPTARGEQVKPAGKRRERCREDILAVIRAEGRPLTYKEVVRELKDAGAKHGSSTVAKALADLTAGGELINPKDKKGYRMPGWMRRKTPSLFD